MKKYKYLVYSYTVNSTADMISQFDFIRICSTEEQAKAVIRYEFDTAPIYDHRPVWLDDSSIKLTGVLGEETFIMYDAVNYDDENQPLMRYVERDE